MWDPVPQLGMEPGPLPWEHGVLATGPPGKPRLCITDELPGGATPAAGLQTLLGSERVCAIFQRREKCVCVCMWRGAGRGLATSYSCALAALGRCLAFLTLCEPHLINLLRPGRACVRDTGAFISQMERPRCWGSVTGPRSRGAPLE